MWEMRLVRREPPGSAVSPLDGLIVNVAAEGSYMAVSISCKREWVGKYHFSRLLDAVQDATKTLAHEAERLDLAEADCIAEMREDVPW